MDEAGGPDLRAHGRFRVYVLRKRGWNTVDLLQRLARRFDLPFEKIQYGGRKDRYAATSQFITIEDPRDCGLREADYSLEAVGYADRPMSAAQIAANHFEITVRGLRPGVERSVHQNLDELCAAGLINYFDDQRFGAYDRERGFMATHWIKGDPLTALRVYLTAAYPGEKKSARDHKQELDAAWGNWARCVALSASALEKRVFVALRADSRAPSEIVRLLPRDDLSMALSALQSAVWNDAAARLVPELDAQFLVTPGKVAPLRFYRMPESAQLTRWERVNLPLPGPGWSCSEAAATRALREALAAAKLTERDFEGAPQAEVFFSAAARDLILRPADFQVLFEGPDDLYPGKTMFRFRFTLPRGCFGSMVIKRLMIGRGSARPW